MASFARSCFAWKGESRLIPHGSALGPRYKVCRNSMETENSWGLPSSSPVTASQAAPTQKMGDTMDTAFCGNWFPRGESMDNRGSQRLQGNRLVSARCDRCPVISETWRITGASLRIPPPRPLIHPHSSHKVQVALVRHGRVRRV